MREKATYRDQLEDILNYTGQKRDMTIAQVVDYTGRSRDWVKKHYAHIIKDGTINAVNLARERAV